MLRIDLLPRSIARGRRNVKLAFFGVAGIVAALILVFLWLGQINADIARTEQELAEVKEKADEVRQLKTETQNKQAELDPIQAKIDFVKDAGESGEQFFDRFEDINEYIYERAQMTEFSITPPDSVSMTVTVHGTSEAGRFVLNLIRCPHLQSIEISGMTGGPAIEPTGSDVSVSMDPETEEISFRVQAQLADGVSIPTPPGAGGDGGGRGGMEMGMPGEFGREDMPPPGEEMPMEDGPPPPPE
ncbi:MAG: PilN domain-containing protein [Armatimonadota bacterium]